MSLDDKIAKPPKVSIKVNDKKEIINFKKQKVGKYKITFVERELLFTLLGMAVKPQEIKEMTELSIDVIGNGMATLQNKGLVDNIATVKKKKMRGDSHLNVYWQLTETGTDVAQTLLDYFNEIISKQSKKTYQPLTKEG